MQQKTPKKAAAKTVFIFFLFFLTFSLLLNADLVILLTKARIIVDGQHLTP